MLLYLMAIQTIVLFIAHLVPCGITATIVTTLALLLMASVGGYAVHVANVPEYLRWMELITPQKWLTPLLTESEYSAETLVSITSQQQCRNKQVRSPVATWRSASRGTLYEC